MIVWRAFLLNLYLFWYCYDDQLAEKIGLTDLGSFPLYLWVPPVILGLLTFISNLAKDEKE